MNSVFVQGLILIVAFHTVNDCVGDLITVVPWQSTLGGGVVQITRESISLKGNSIV
jgi:hypothetical protein